MKQILNICVWLFLVSFVFAQTGTRDARSFNTLNGNMVRTVFTNNGILAQPSNEWPMRLAWKNDKNGYVSDCSILIGVELPIKDYNNDSKPDTVHVVEVTPVDRPGGGKGTGAKFWGFEPLPGYFTNKVALSTDASTWPSIWPDHPEYGSNVWNGLNGANSFTGNMEAYYRMDDQNDDQMYNAYGFLPDSTNLSRRGVGIEVGVRLIQFWDTDFQDVLFRVYDIKNTGTVNYNKVVFGNLTGTYVGGQGDEWNDDVSLFYPRDNMVIVSDFDNYIRPTANPQWVGKVGKFGEKFLSTPVGNKFASYNYFVPAGNITLSNNEDLWKRLTPGKYVNPSSVVMSADSIPTATRGEDGDYIYGSGQFPLNAKETKRVISAIAFGNSNDEVKMNLKKAEVLANCDFQISKISSAINIQGLAGNTLVSGLKNITWQADSECTSVEIWYSPDLGKTWFPITRESPNTGSYSWSSADVKNSPIAKLRIFAKKSGVCYGFSDSPIFTLKNGTANSLFLHVDQTDNDFPGSVTDGYLKCVVYVASLNTLPLRLQVFYSLDNNTYFFGQENQFASSQTSQAMNYTISTFPNSKTFSLKFLLTDGVDTVFETTTAFDKNNYHDVIPYRSHHFLSTSPDATVYLRELNRDLITNNMYRVTFNDTVYGKPKMLSVYDRTNGKYLIRDFAYSNGCETPAFEGNSLYINDFESHMDSSRSGWNIAKPENLNKLLFRRYIDSQSKVMGQTPPKDYMLVFSDKGEYSSIDMSLFLKFSFPAVNGINFTAYEIPVEGNPMPVKFGFMKTSANAPNKLASGDAVVLSDSKGSILSYIINFMDTSSYIPTKGDTLRIYTKKGLTIYDTLYIDQPSGIAESSHASEKSYKLFQNYPNPFNPTTVISYQLATAGKVTLKIFDVLGKEVTTLVNEEKSAGSYSVNFNAVNLPSGVYFYCLKSGGFVETKKLLLLK